MWKNVLKVRLSRRGLVAVLAVLCSFAVSTPASAQDRLCDPGGEDCRQILIDHIRAENVGLDVAFWFMEDSWIASEIIARHNAGVPVRVLMDTRANAPNPRNAQRLAELAAARIPMRERFAPGILHWKTMIFAGQGLVEFSGANYSSDAWTPANPNDPPYTNYVDEIIYFTRKPTVVQSFMRKYDELWLNTTQYRDYANINQPLWRAYPGLADYPFDPELNFPPAEDYGARAVNTYYTETQKMDVIMYRITDRRHTDALIDLHVNRGLPVRLITDPQQYRDPNRLWHSWNVDRLYMAGIPIKVRAHAGLNHQKSILLYGRAMSIFGSSNWTSPSAFSQEEHNYFTGDSLVFNWLVAQFERKWNNSTGVIENTDFVPLPPRAPDLPSPAYQATGIQTTGLSLQWDGSPWAHLYDVYLGTSPSSLELIGENLPLGPSQYYGHLRSFAVPFALQPGTQYYWRVVGKTMANMTATSGLWTFTTSGDAPPPPSLPTPWESRDIGLVGLSGSSSYSAGTFTVRGAGADIWGTADALQYVYQPVSGDVDIIARVASVENVHAWVKAGVMIRETLTASSAQAMMLVSPGKGLAFQRRVSTSGESTSTSGGAGTAPAWVKLERRGNTITAFRSDNGSTWTQVGSDTFAMGANVYVGLAVSSHSTSQLATATFSDVTVSGGGSTPTNVSPTVSISSPASGATFTAPASIDITADAADSDGTVASVEFFAGSTLIGTDTTAPYAITWSNVAAGSYALTARATDNAGATTTSAAVNVTVSGGSTPSLPAPWSSQDIGAVGATGNASESGGTFTVRGAGADVWGTADAFHYVWQQVSGDLDVVARVATIEPVNNWTKVGVMIRESLSTDSAHAFMLGSPGKGIAFQRRVATGGVSTNTSGGAGTAPVWVKLERRGTTITAYRSADGSAWTLVGSDTFSMGSTVYVGLAVSSHVAGTLATATFSDVSVTRVGDVTPTNTPPTVTLTSPASGASFTAPATIDLAATAADSDGTVARVEFYNGTTLLATATTSPYTATWTDVAAGTYTITARAYDDVGASTTSSATTITVNGTTPPSLPAPWSSQDVGAVGVAGSASASGGTFTIRGSGADIWGSADGFHFASQQLTGDFDIVGRVTSVEWAHHWAKAGVMVRDSLAANSAHGFMLVSAGRGLAFQRRLTTGAESLSTAGSAATAPMWVKLERRGTTLTAYQSTDGVTWTLVGSDTFGIGATVSVGLAVTSHDNSRTATAIFDNVSVTPR